MAKNQNTTEIENAASSFVTRFLELQGVFLRKGFWGKINASLLIIIALAIVVFTIGYLLLAWFASFVFSVMGDKATTKMRKVVSKGNGKSYKTVLNGKFVQDGIDSATLNVAKAIGMKLDVEIHKGLPFEDRGNLRKYFRLLKIKDKAALLLISNSDCQTLLKQYNKAYMTPRNLEKTIAAEKLAKKANKKLAKNTRSTVLAATSWSSTGKTVVSPVI